jgi:hypothetical protein
MRAFFGVVFALLALLCGGCSLAFIGASLTSNAGDMVVFLALGGIPALIFGLSAWSLLKPRPASSQPTVAPANPDNYSEEIKDRLR